MYCWIYLFLLFRFESLLCAPEPVPLYALKLLVSMTEHSSEICRYPTDFQLTKNVQESLI